MPALCGSCGIERLGQTPGGRGRLRSPLYLKQDQEDFIHRLCFRPPDVAVKRKSRRVVPPSKSSIFGCGDEESPGGDGADGQTGKAGASVGEGPMTSPRRYPVNDVTHITMPLCRRPRLGRLRWPQPAICTYNLIYARDVVVAFTGCLGGKTKCTEMWGNLWRICRKA